MQYFVKTNTKVYQETFTQWHKNDKIFRTELFFMRPETGWFLTPVVTAGCMAISPFSPDHKIGEMPG